MSLVKDAIADQKIPFICIAAGALALFASFLSEPLEALVAVPIAICGLPIICGAIVGVVKEHDITADVLVSVAIVASILIGEYDAAAEIAIIMALHKIEWALNTVQIERNDAGSIVFTPAMH